MTFRSFLISAFPAELVEMQKVAQRILELVCYWLG